MSDIRNQLLRGEILRALSWSLPRPMSELLIATHLESLGLEMTDSDLAAHMFYLREKGYVSSEHLTDVATERWMHTLTPKGTDLIERNIPEDPGIKTPRVA